MVDRSGAFMDRKKKCYDKMGLIPTRIMVAYLKINTCHPLSIPFHGMTQNATEWKISVFPMELNT